MLSYKQLQFQKESEGRKKRVVGVRGLLQRPSRTFYMKSAKYSLQALQNTSFPISTHLTLVSVSICFPNHAITMKKAQGFGNSCPLQPASETQRYDCLV